MYPPHRRFILAFACLPVLLLGAAVAGPEAPPPAGTEGAGPDLIVLVRHAERDGPSASDPGLTATGSERARALVRLLADAGITRIHSTDTRRTRETAAPLAAALGTEVELYDGRDLPTLVFRLASEPGRHLVVGHSNTTPELAGLLGGEPHGEIVEEWEYDRLYLLTPGSEERMRTVLLRFGPPVDRPEGYLPTP